MTALKTRTETRFEGLTVYVDPSAGYIYLKVVTGESGQLSMHIKDQEGNIIADQMIPANQLTSVSIQSIQPGAYHVHVSLSNGMLSEIFRF